MTSAQAETARILIADDELTFLNSTADLLRQAGYQCSCAPDAATAAKMLKTAEYDLLIADIKMPGNPELELIQELPRVSKGIPVILVTGYPSFKSALQSIRLPVFAYVVKPIDFDTMLVEVRTTLRNHQVYEAITDARRHLEKLGKGLLDLLGDEKPTPGEFAASPFGPFICVIVRNIIKSLSDLKHLSETSTADGTMAGICRLVNCPPEIVLTEVLEQANGLQKKARQDFQSKEITNLQKRLDELAKNDVVSRRSA